MNKDQFKQSLTQLQLDKELETLIFELVDSTEQLTQTHLDLIADIIDLQAIIYEQEAFDLEQEAFAYEQAIPAENLQSQTS